MFRRHRTNESGATGRPPRRRRWASLLYACLLAAGVFAAWQVHEFWILRRPPAPHLPSPPATDEPSSKPQWSFSRPADIPAGSLAPSGLKDLPGEPGDLPPPPLAKRASAFESRALGLLRQQARYELADQAGQAAEYYLSLLKGRGFTLLADRTDSSGRRELLWRAGQTTVNLALRKPAPDDKIVVVLIVSCPAPNEGSGR